MNLFYELHRLQDKIHKNTYKTIVGQIKAGDSEGAATGIERIKKEIEKGVKSNDKRRKNTKLCTQDTTKKQTGIL